MICLQGGAEFGLSCREMDADLLRRAGGGPVVVVALAGAPGREYDTATANGVRHFAALGAASSGAPDARTDPEGALAAIREANVVVLPGGSPARLLEALVGTGVGAALRSHAVAGRAVMGSSAGAMVLCSHTVLPGRNMRVVDALGLVPNCLVVPHYRGQTEWPVPADVTLLGLPECAGVFVDGRSVTAAGAAASTVCGERVAVGATVSRP